VSNWDTQPAGNCAVRRCRSLLARVRTGYLSGEWTGPGLEMRGLKMLSSEISVNFLQASLRNTCCSVTQVTETGNSWQGDGPTSQSLDTCTGVRRKKAISARSTTHKQGEATQAGRTRRCAARPGPRNFTGAAPLTNTLHRSPSARTRLGETLPQNGRDVEKD